MDNEREPDGFKIAAEQNIISARFNARTKMQRDPSLQQFHKSMMAAAHNGVLETFTSAMPLTVQKSIVNWADADPNSNGKTALMEAAGGGHTEIVKQLLSIGADVSLVDDTGHAALSSAAGKGNTETMLALLDAGANVNHRSTQGWTPLMEAVMGGKAAAALLLLERGCDTRTPTPYGENITAKARKMGHENIALLIEAEEKKRGADAAKKLVAKGTAETITVSRPLRLKSGR